MINRRDCLKYITLGSASLIAAAKTASAAAPTIQFKDLYGPKLQFSPQARQLNGQVIQMKGYVAPPLKPDIHFFVISRLPLFECPFCNEEAEWPDNIVVVYSKKAIPTDVTLIDIKGRLELGTKTDKKTGFVSRVRIMDAKF
jgi:hypothetical protein